VKAYVLGHHEDAVSICSQIDQLTACLYVEAEGLLHQNVEPFSQALPGCRQVQSNGEADDRSIDVPCFQGCLEVGKDVNLLGRGQIYIDAHLCVEAIGVAKQLISWSKVDNGSESHIRDPADVLRMGKTHETHAHEGDSLYLCHLSSISPMVSGRSSVLVPVSVVQDDLQVLDLAPMKHLIHPSNLLELKPMGHQAGNLKFPFRYEFHGELLILLP
jgi:hypothetical protein